MTLSCLHTHSVFCDGETDIESMCETAHNRGFSSIGFSSHAPITKKTGIESVWHMKDEKIDEYIDTVLAARKRWKGKLSVYLGLEVDYIKGCCGPSDPDIQALPLDYLIGSIHYIPSPKDSSPFNMDTWPEGFGEVLELFDNDGRAICETYYKEYNDMIKSGGCDILGHLDLVKKNNDRYKFFSSEEGWYKNILVDTADRIVLSRTEAEKNGGRINGNRVPVVEVNTGCIIRNYCSEAYPSFYMMRLLAERNIPLVLNADAHRPDHLGGAYETALEAMKQAGYNTMVFFEGRENGKALWRDKEII